MERDETACREKMLTLQRTQEGKACCARDVGGLHGRYHAYYCCRKRPQSHLPHIWKRPASPTRICECARPVAGLLRHLIQQYPYIRSFHEGDAQFVKPLKVNRMRLFIWLTVKEAGSVQDPRVETFLQERQSHYVVSNNGEGGQDKRAGWKLRQARTTAAKSAMSRHSPLRSVSSTSHGSEFAQSHARWRGAESSGGRQGARGRRRRGGRVIWSWTRKQGP